MTGLDTNILVRYLTQDDPIQSARASRIIERSLSVTHPSFVSLVTVAEVVWVLARRYRMTNLEIAAVVERLLQAESLALQNEQQVFTAMIALKTGRGSFSDALISALGKWAGCDATLTFDKKALRLAGFAPAS